MTDDDRLRDYIQNVREDPNPHVVDETSRAALERRSYQRAGWVVAGLVFVLLVATVAIGYAITYGPYAEYHNAVDTVLGTFVRTYLTMLTELLVFYSPFLFLLILLMSLYVRAKAQRLAGFQTDD